MREKRRGIKGKLKVENERKLKENKKSAKRTCKGRI